MESVHSQQLRKVLVGKAPIADPCDALDDRRVFFDHEDQHRSAAEGPDFRSDVDIPAGVHQRLHVGCDVGERHDLAGTGLDRLGKLRSQTSRPDLIGLDRGVAFDLDPRERLFQ